MERKKPVLHENYCCDEVEDIMKTLVERFDVGQMEVKAFEDVFNQHYLTNLDFGNVYRDEKTKDLNIEALVSRLFEIASLFKGDVRAFFFDAYLKEGERHNSRRIGETDFHIAKMKIENRLRETNTSRPESKYELVVRPPNTHRWKLQSQIEEIKRKGKIPVEVCCPGTEPVYKGLIERFNPTEKDLKVFEQVFYEHTLTNLLVLIQSEKRKGRELNLDKVLDEVFAYAKLLSLEIQPFFFDSYMVEIERLNDHKQMFLTVHTLKDKLAARRNLERTAELELGNPIPPEKDREAKPVKLEKGDPPKQKVLALFHFYMRVKGCLPVFIPGNKEKEMEEIAIKNEKSYEKFRQVYAAMEQREKRMTISNLENIEAVIPLLADCPTAQKLAEDELKTIKSKV